MSQPQPTFVWPPRMEKVLDDAGTHVATLLPDYGLLFDAREPVLADNHEHAQKLAAESQLLGHSDWVLPESHELQLLIRHDRYRPAIDTEFFPNTPTNDWYWTNTAHASVPAYAWGVVFNYGLVASFHRGGSGFVRAVRRVPVR